MCSFDMTHGVARILTRETQSRVCVILYELKASDKINCRLFSLSLRIAPPLAAGQSGLSLISGGKVLVTTLQVQI